MFTDINRYKYAYSIRDRDNDINIRRNPFLNNYDTDDFNDELLQKSLPNNSNNLVVSNYFNRNLTSQREISSVDSLNISIKQCKQEILNLIDNREQKEKLIQRLTELNEELHLAKEARKLNESRLSVDLDSDFVVDNVLFIAGHSLTKIRQRLTPVRHCEVCGGTVLTTRGVYRCSQCVVCVHDYRNCLQGLCRSCPGSNKNAPAILSSRMAASSKLSTTTNDNYLNIDSYPITGNLTSQRFLCAECNRPLRVVSNTDPYSSQRYITRFCSYYGKFYCSSCHWGNKFFNPAVFFMLNIWKKMSVCRSAYIYLNHAWDKALFRIPVFWQQNNHDIKNILSIRRKLFSLRLFIHGCPILHKMIESSPDWIIDQPYLVTMKFVEGISDGSTLETVQVLYSSIVSHIPQCENCKRLCHSCYICQDSEKLYVMSRTVWTCSLCFVTCIHEHCGLRIYKEKSEYICHNCHKYSID